VPEPEQVVVTVDSSAPKKERVKGTVNGEPFEVRKVVLVQDPGEETALWVNGHRVHSGALSFDGVLRWTRP
jgi:hypothetical protein